MTLKPFSPKSKKILCFLVLALILISAVFTGCKSKSPVPSDTETDTKIEDSDKNTEEKDSAPDSSEKEDTPEEEVPKSLPYVDPLTGLPCEKDYTSLRPIAVMINNIKQAIPQYGISEADILYECTVEGGITRLMGVFPDYASLPLLGSVRSSRDYYIDLAQAHDALYAHCGGSPDAYTAISTRKIQNIDGVNGSKAASDAYWKDPERVRNMGYEHASMTNGEKMAQAVEALGYRTELSEGFTQPLQFAETDAVRNGDKVLSLNVEFSFYAQSFFSYDPVRTAYIKGQYGKVHIDAGTGYPLTFKNILLLSATYRNIAGDEKNRLDLNFTGTGKGYYISNGEKTDIVYKKPDRQTPYRLYEADGETPLLLNPGKTYIGIIGGLSSVTLSEEPDARLTEQSETNRKDSIA